MVKNNCISGIYLNHDETFNEYLWLSYGQDNRTDNEKILMNS